MNFSEYIAILSGDTTLLEKSKMEKKIALLESLRNAHHKEVFRSRLKLENMQEDKTKALQTLAGFFSYPNFSAIPTSLSNTLQ